MNSADLKSFQKQLLALQDRLGGDISHLTEEALNSNGDEAHGNLSHMPLHMADLGTDNFERENTLNLLANEEQMLKEIGAALERIDAGKFGKCEECQGDIARPRLKELPYTRFCVECARKLDKHKP
jgi:RNA polymerase-binding transcription factor DksA